MTEQTTDPETIARAATVHGLLNCYFRETRNYERREPAAIDHSECDVVFHSKLSNVGIELSVPVRYDSPTGRHLFVLPVWRTGPDAERIELDYTTLATLIVRELALSDAESDSADDLLLRVIRSCQNTARYVAARDDFERLYGDDPTFRDAEQSLLFGHLLHPTPKSRQGIVQHEEPTYAPELRGGFQLHYFRAPPERVRHESARSESAVEWVTTELRKAGVSNDVLEDHALLPVHPWQASYLLDQPHVTAATEEGTLEHVGALGPTFYPTSSVRTLYSPTTEFMVKGSLNVTITNSVRTNKRPELRRGVAVAELLDTDLGTQLRERFPGFEVIRDPASLTLDLGSGRESGFEVVLRENPFCAGNETGVTPVVALCQDHVHSPHLTDHSENGTRSRLSNIIRTLADREGRSTAAVSEAWFRQYLSISVRPVLWLYLTHGVGLEAHQQNSVLSMAEGYPDRFYYRDNQGYYFCESTYDAVDALLPGVGERADTICRDDVTDERIRYYVIINNAFGLINAFGAAGLVEERRLLELLRSELQELRAFDRDSSTLLEELLTSRTIPCKANLLTRFHGMDELEGSIENQSVYTEINNPLVTELEVR